MFFESFDALARVAIMSVCAYFWLVLILRIAGKRSLSKLNAFDFAVTVAFGSTLATILLSKDTTFAEGALALGMLTLLQFIVSKSSLASKLFRRAIRSEPAMVFEKGCFLEDAMKRERVTHNEVEQAIRNQGVGRRDQVEAVILETDGSFSVLKRSEQPPDLLDSVRRGT